MSANVEIFGSAISGAVVGGFIAGFFVLAATKRSFDHQKKLADENDLKLLKGLLQAIHAEIETIFERYQETMGVQIESLSEDEVLNAYYALFSDYFTIYNGNSSLIGRIPDNDLRKQIVKTYTMAKGMVDSFRLNNDLVGKLEYADNMFDETQLEVHKKQARTHLALLASYSKTLKSAHGSFKEEVSKLLRKLEENEILNEKN